VVKLFQDESGGVARGFRGMLKYYLEEAAKHCGVIFLRREPEDTANEQDQ